MNEDRKVQGDQWYVTLPKLWRDGHIIAKGDEVTMHYQSNSVLILNPKNRELQAIELDLINLLLNYPSWKISEETVQALKDIVHKIEA